MRNFEDWFKELCSNYVWFQPASMHHEPKTFQDTANKVYMQYVAAEVFPPIQEARRHVYNKLVLIPGDKRKIDWTKRALEKVESEKKQEWQPVTEEERERWLKKWQESVSNCQMISAVPKMTAKQIIEQGDWRAVQPLENRDEFVRAMVLEEHVQKVNEARAKVFRSAYPDASEEEVQAYIKKFDTI